MAQKQYQQLTIEEREKIQLGLWSKKSIRTIAYELGRSPSTISREVKRNIPVTSNRKYFPRIANIRATIRRKITGKRVRLKHPLIRSYVHEKLTEGLSPEQISGRLKIDHPKHSISHEAIYQYIYAQYRNDGSKTLSGGCDLRKYLKRHHRVRRPRKIPLKEEKTKIVDRILIDERPKYIEKRKQQGHWEGDSMISRKSLVGLNTLVERASGLVFISKIKNCNSKETTKAVINRFSGLPEELRRTLTLDNGSENAGHKNITKELKTRCYFAHPYHSWERGTNENTNGLIRWYLPKGTDFAKVDDKEVEEIENKLNNRPRKRLRFKTPLEVFNN